MNYKEIYEYARKLESEIASTSYRLSGLQKEFELESERLKTESAPKEKILIMPFNEEDFLSSNFPHDYWVQFEGHIYVPRGSWLNSVILRGISEGRTLKFKEDH